MRQTQENLTFQSLPEDILLSILVQTASDLNSDMHSRIKQTLRNMRVCTGWQQIINESAAIWGRLVWVNCSIKGIDWLSRCLEKSKSSLLWIEGEVFASFSAIFFRALSEHWERVERLVIEMHKVDEEEATRQLRLIYLRPAPFLRTFFLYMSEARASSWLQRDSDILPFLMDHSKRIQHIGTHFIHNLGQINLTNLKTLYIHHSESGRNSDIRDLFHALQLIPRLETLGIFSSFQVGLRDSSGNGPPGVTLPFLTAMAIHTDIDTFLSLWNSIKPSPNGCLTTCRVNTVSSNVELTSEQYLLELQPPFERILSDHVRLRHAPSQQRLTRVEISMTNTGFELSDPCEILYDGNHHHRSRFGIGITWRSMGLSTWEAGQICTSIFCSSLLNDVEGLSIDMSLVRRHSLCVDHYVPFIRAFTSVELLALDIVTLSVFRRMVDASMDPNTDLDCKTDTLIFPNLVTLSLNAKYQYSYGIFSMKRLRKCMFDTVSEFLLSRASNGCAVKVLSLDYRVDEIHRVLYTLDYAELRGLRVNWMDSKGSPKTFVYEAGGFFEYDFVVDGVTVLGSDCTA